jgi:hypothetical protein
VATTRDVSKVIVSARDGHSARARALEQIADLNEEITSKEDPDFDPESTHDAEQDAELAKSIAQGGEAAETAEEPAEQAQEPQEDEEPAGEEPETEPPAEEPEEPAPPKQAKQPRKIKIKVNGQDLELTEEELIARAQKVESADQYLAEAARVRHQASQQPSQPDTASTAHPSDEEDAALARALQLGTEDESVAALRKLRQSASAQTDQIVAAVDERIAFRQAVDKFSENFSDIFADPLLKNLAFALDKHFMELGDKRPYGERYAEIGNLIRDKMRELAKQYGTDEAKLKEKAQRKAQAPSAPKAAGTKATPDASEEEEDGPEDYSKWIRSEAERRGKHYGVI